MLVIPARISVGNMAKIKLVCINSKEKTLYIEVKKTVIKNTIRLFHHHSNTLLIHPTHNPLNPTTDFFSLHESISVAQIPRDIY